MIFYEGSKLEVIEKAIEDEVWEEEKDLLSKVKEYVKYEQEILETMATQEWIENPFEFEEFNNGVKYRRVEHRDIYIVDGKAFHLENGGYGWRIGLEEEEKKAYIQIRVEDSLKNEFYSKCEENFQTPSVVLRGLIKNL